MNERWTASIFKVDEKIFRKNAFAICDDIIPLNPTKLRTTAVIFFLEKSKYNLNLYKISEMLQNLKTEC